MDHRQFGGVLPVLPALLKGAGQNFSDQEFSVPVSLTQLSLTRSFQDPLAGLDAAFTVKVPRTSSALSLAL